jgi:hypothetical protein
MRRYLSIAALLLALLLLALPALAQESPNYDLSWSTMDAAGGTSQSGNYTHTGTLGQLDAGVSSSANHTLVGGFWAGAYPTGISIQAVTNLRTDVDTDNAAGVAPAIPQVLGTPALIAGYVASLSYPGTLINVLEVRLQPPFDTGEANIDNTAGLTQFSAVAPAGASPPIDPLTFAPVRLLGCVPDVATMTLNFSQIADYDGTLIPQQQASQRTYRRGDAKADGTISVADLLFIAQYQVGLRNVGDDPSTEVNAVNAASVRQDSPYDTISTADLLFLAQYLVGLRDDCMDLVPLGSPPQR